MALRVFLLGVFLLVAALCFAGLNSAWAAQEWGQQDEVGQKKAEQSETGQKETGQKEAKQKDDGSKSTLPAEELHDVEVQRDQNQVKKLKFIRQYDSFLRVLIGEDDIDNMQPYERNFFHAVYVNDTKAVEAWPAQPPVGLEYSDRVKEVALQMAAHYNQVSMLKKLLSDRRYQVNDTNFSKTKALRSAVLGKALEAVHVLSHYGAQIGPNEFKQAVKSGYVEMANFILNKIRTSPPFVGPNAYDNETRTKKINSLLQKHLVDAIKSNTSAMLVFMLKQLGSLTLKPIKWLVSPRTLWRVATSVPKANPDIKARLLEFYRQQGVDKTLSSCQEMLRKIRPRKTTES